VIDENGYLRILGRLKDLIIRGGENVYPAEIEKFLFTHPAIEDVQIVGVPDERMGEEICAWVRLRKGQSLSADELRAYCKGKIAHYKIPKYVLFKSHGEFPVTVTGKVQKFKMREISTRELLLENVKPHWQNSKNASSKQEEKK